MRTLSLNGQSLSNNFRGLLLDGQQFLQPVPDLVNARKPPLTPDQIANDNFDQIMHQRNLRPSPYAIQQYQIEQRVKNNQPGAENFVQVMPGSSYGQNLQPVYLNVSQIPEEFRGMITDGQQNLILGKTPYSATPPAPPPPKPVFQRPNFAPPPIPETGPLNMPNIPQLFQNMNFAGVNQNALPSWYKPTATPPQFPMTGNSQSGFMPKMGAMPTLGSPFKLG